MLLAPLVLALALFYTFGVESFACHDHGTESADRPCAVCQFGSAHKVVLPDVVVELVDPDPRGPALRPRPLESATSSPYLALPSLRAPPSV